jgi:hypothetical protein
MSESLPEPLSRFTPDVGRLDPAAVLFAAGRRSARPNRGWVALAATLAASQALSLALLWPHPTPPASPSGPAAPWTTSPGPSEPTAVRAPDSPGVWTAGRSFREPEADDSPPPANAVTIVDSGPPLRAFGPPPKSILN